MVILEENFFKKHRFYILCFVILYLLSQLTLSRPCVSILTRELFKLKI